MESRYFCSHCRTNFGTATGALQFDASAASALFTLANDEVSLTLPLAVSGNQLIGDDSSDDFLFTKDGVAQPVTRFEGLSHFFGPGAENAGLLFSLFQQEGLFTGASVGHQE